MNRSSNRICRVCLTPEDAETFTSIFDNNAQMALKIYRIAKVSILDVNPALPSLICKKCENDIEAVEKLKLRILDADEYFYMLTGDAEKKFFDEDVKKLMESKLATTPKPRKNKSNNKMATPKQVSAKKKKKIISKSAPTNSRPKGLKTKDGREKLKAVKKSVPMIWDDEGDISESEIFIKPVEEPKFIPSALPARFGIQRMIAKSKSFFMNKPKVDRKNNANKGGKMAILAARSSANVISFECDTCLKTFKTSRDLNQHMETHNDRFNCTLCEATFDSADHRYSHVRLIHGVMA